MGVGDEILAAGQAQRLWDSDPSNRLKIAIFGKDGQPRWHPIWDGNPILATPGAFRRGEPVRRIVSGPECRPYIVYPFSATSGWTFNREFRCRDYPARIYLTPEECERGDAAERKYGTFVLIEPFTKHANFRWPLDRWQALVESCPDLTFVQHIHADSPLLPGVAVEPATFREACGLMTTASAYVRSESGLCHAAAALGCPTVTLFGGCMDATVMGGYERQICLVDTGPGSPCGSWMPCQHCVEAMARISVEQVQTALRQALEE